VRTSREAKSIGHADTLRIVLPDARGWDIGRLPRFRKPDKSQRRSFANGRQSKSERSCSSTAADVRYRHHFENLSMTGDTPPLGQPNAELEQLAPLQKVMLGLAAIGAAILFPALFYLMFAMN
jgi:hypothetical protein